MTITGPLGICDSHPASAAPGRPQPVPDPLPPHSRGVLARPDLQRGPFCARRRRPVPRRGLLSPQPPLPLLLHTPSFPELPWPRVPVCRPSGAMSPPLARAVKSGADARPGLGPQGRRPADRMQGSHVSPTPTSGRRGAAQHAGPAPAPRRDASPARAHVQRFLPAQPASAAVCASAAGSRTSAAGSRPQAPAGPWRPRTRWWPGTSAARRTGPARSCSWVGAACSPGACLGRGPASGGGRKGILEGPPYSIFF